jgi:hypothetical protein
VTANILPWFFCNPSEITMSAGAHDGNGLSKIELYIDGVKVHECPVSAFDAYCEYSMIYGVAGDHVFKAVAYDVCGNTGEDTKQFHCLGGGAITPLDPCGKKLVLYNPAGQSLTDQYTLSTAASEPEGTTYEWDVPQGEGDDKAGCVSGCTTQTATYQAKAASAAENDVRIRVKIMNSGFTCNVHLLTTVQKPTRVERQYLGYVARRCDPPYMEIQFRDTVFDQIGAGAATPRAFCDESWTIPMWENDRYTDCNGQVLDHWFSTMGGICDARGILASGDQTVSVSGWGCLLGYHREDWDGVPGSIVYSNIGCP